MHLEILIARDGSVQKGGYEHQFKNAACISKEQCDVYEDTAIVKHLVGSITAHRLGPLLGTCNIMEGFSHSATHRSHCSDISIEFLEAKLVGLGQILRDRSGDEDVDSRDACRRD